jgi:hypothetical protein
MCGAAKRTRSQSTIDIGHKDARGEQVRRNHTTHVIRSWGGGSPAIKQRDRRILHPSHDELLDESYPRYGGRVRQWYVKPSVSLFSQSHVWSNSVIVSLSTQHAPGTRLSPLPLSFVIISYSPQCMGILRRFRRCRWWVTPEPVRIMESAVARTLQQAVHAVASQHVLFALR